MPIGLLARKEGRNFLSFLPCLKATQITICDHRLPLRTTVIQTLLENPMRALPLLFNIRTAFMARRSGGRNYACAMQPKQYTILEYKYVADISQRREPFREQHLAYARSKAVEGKLVLGGAAGSPIDSGVLIWKETPLEEIESFIENDIYVRNGLVTAHQIRPFHVLVEA